jgi:hypothetical protein
MNEQKKCTCKEPKLSQGLPQGFKGTIKCGSCGGLFSYPPAPEEYKGSDPVEKLLFDLSKRSNSLTVEEALLRTLVDIKNDLKDLGKAIAAQLSGKEPAQNQQQKTGQPARR